MGFSTQPTASCDAAGCSKSTIVSEHEAMPGAWLRGTVYNDADDPVRWVACGMGHTRPAITQVLDEDQRAANHNANNASTNNVTTDKDNLA